MKGTNASTSQEDSLQVHILCHTCTLISICIRMNWLEISGWVRNSRNCSVEMEMPTTPHEVSCQQTCCPMPQTLQYGFGYVSIHYVTYKQRICTCQFSVYAWSRIEYSTSLLIRSPSAHWVMHANARHSDVRNVRQAKPHTTSMSLPSPPSSCWR